MGASGSVLFIDEKNKKGSIGFSKAMFNQKEWACLQKFCIEKDITQKDLNRVFNKYCTDENVVLRQMRVDLAMFKNLFVNNSSVNKETVDVLVPQVFMRDHEELMPPHSAEEVSFARFIVMGYMFCAQPVQDMIFDIISISRNNPKIQLKAVLYTYNLQQMITVLSEDTPKSAALDYCLKRASIQNDMEISIELVMRIAMKYPIGFFQLIRFRQKFRRCLFGDKFWLGRPYLESRYFEFGDGAGFETEERAKLETARAIVLDFELGTPKSLFCTNELRFESDDYVLSTDACTRLKASVGYRAAKELILESKFKFEDSQKFMALAHDHAETVRAYDAKIKKEFMYNFCSGFRSWIDTYRNVDGVVVKEECFRTDPKHLVHFENDSDDNSDDEEGSYYSYDDFSSVGTRSVRSRATRSVKSKASRARKRKNTNNSLTSQSVATAATPMVQPQMLF
jgi:hypothetical protein